MVAIVADGSYGPGRDVMKGATHFANAHRQWEVYGVLRRLSERPTSWPPCDGAIVGGMAPEIFDFMLENSPFLVSCSGSTDPRLSPVVSLDDVAVGKMAADHLLECGLKQFSFYGVPDTAVSNNRAVGFSATLTAAGYRCLPCPLAFPGWSDLQLNRPWTQIADWLESLPKPIGIMAVDDLAGNYLASACRHANIDVPEQVAIIGVNNDDVLCEIACTPLSSVEGGFFRIGKSAALLMDRLLQGEKLSPEQKIVHLPPLGIVKRLSTDLIAVDDLDLANAIRFIRQHACDPCSVGDVAAAVVMGRRDLERRFSQKLNRTPGEEILRVQMETAKRLLREPELGLVDIAERCGFSGTPAFVRAFHRVTETTPVAYRRNAQTASSG